MKILVVAPRLPFPLDKGDRLTVFHLLKHFSQRHEMSLACFLEPGQDRSWINEIALYCRRIEIVPFRKSRAYTNCLKGLAGRTPLQLQYYDDPVMHGVVQRMIDDIQPDLLYSQLIRMGQYIECYRNYPRVAAFNLSMTLNHRRLAEYAPKLSNKLVHSLEYLKLRSFEFSFARAFDRVLYISRHDLEAAEAEQKSHLDNVFFNPHGVDQNHFAPAPGVDKRPNSVVFTGNMQYAPNIDAARFFCHRVLPLLREEVPDATVSVVGTDPTPAVRELASQRGVEVTGKVPDLRAYLHQAQVAVAPIRIGAGLQNKVLEGMSCGLPMVITSVANEGIQAVDGENVMIADTAEAFAGRVAELLRNPARRDQLGSAARDFIVRHWSWEKHFNELEDMFIDLVAEKKQLLREAA